MPWDGSSTQCTDRDHTLGQVEYPNVPNAIIPLAKSSTPTCQTRSYPWPSRVPQRAKRDHTLGQVEYPNVPNAIIPLAKSSTPAYQVRYPNVPDAIIPLAKSSTPAYQAGYPREQVRSGTRTSRLLDGPEANLVGGRSTQDPRYARGGLVRFSTEARPCARGGSGPA
jgi:hypothetical protein